MDQRLSKLELNLEFPVNIDSTLTVNFNVGNFKALFEYLLGVLRTHAVSITSVQNNLLSSFDLTNNELIMQLVTKLDKLTAEAAKETLTHAVEQGHTHTTDSDQLVRKLQKLKQKLSQLEQKLTEQQETPQTQLDTEHFTLKRLRRIDWKLEDFECRFSELEQRAREGHNAILYTPELSESGDEEPENQDVENGPNGKDLEKLNEEAQKQAKDTNYLRKLVLEASQKSEKAYGLVNSALVKSSEHSHQIQRMHLELKELAKSQESLQSEVGALDRTKASLEDFTGLQSYVKSLPKESLRKDLDLLTEKLNYLSSLTVTQDKMSSLHSQVQGLAQALGLKADQSSVNSLENSKTDKSTVTELLALKADKSSLEALEGALKSYGNSLQQLKKLTEPQTAQPEPPQRDPRPRLLTDNSQKETQNRIAALSKRVFCTEEQLKLLYLPEGNSLISLLNDIEGVRGNYSELYQKLAELGHSVRDLRAALKDKAESSVLNDFQAALQNKLLELAKSMKTQYADRTETKRALKHLEILHRETAKTREKTDGDDAMLARKPLGGWSCASCERKLEKLLGKQGPYRSWNKLPYRDPADRMVRAGPGFSKMLASLSSDLRPGFRAIPEDDFISLPSVVRPSTTSNE